MSTYCEKGLMIKQELADIAEETGIQMNYRNTMPSGEPAHYVQYRPDEKSPWTSRAMRDYKNVNTLLTEIRSWKSLLYCMHNADRMRKETREATND